MEYKLYNTMFAYIFWWPGGASFLDCCGELSAAVPGHGLQLAGLLPISQSGHRYPVSITVVVS